MTNLFELNQYINTCLDTLAYPDGSVNGLQVESNQVEVQKIAVAVDAGQAVIEKAVEERAQLLIVHHGLFWGQCVPVVGPLAKKIDLLISNGCSLIAQHLPLDGHPKLGNNAQLAQFFELSQVSGFWPHGTNQFIGVQGRLKQAKDLNYFLAKAKDLPGFNYQLTLPFGKEKVESVAIVSGGGTDAIPLAVAEKFDLFISGEPKQQVYHDCQENNLNALFLGHYATETLGVRALAEHLKSKFPVETVFIDLPTGI